MDINLKKEPHGFVLEMLSQNDAFHGFPEVDFPRNDIADKHANYSGASPYHLNYCGYSSCEPGYTFGPNIRSSYLIHIVSRGCGKYFIGDRAYDVQAGQMFLIYPGITTTYQADTEEPWTYYWVGFSGHQSEYILSQMGFRREQPVVTIGDVTPLTDCVARMIRTHKITLPNELLRTSELLRFFALAISSQPAEFSEGKHSHTEYAELAMRYLTKNYQKKIHISALASYIGVDRSYLTKSFKARYHVSPQEYLLRLRISKAIELLENTRKSVNAIALQCGYQDALAFTKMFRQRIGSSPTEYRQTLGDTLNDET